MRALAVALTAALVSAACGGPTVDVAKALQVTDVTTGWSDAGVTNGENRILPAIQLKVKNNSNQALPVLQLNALFRRVTEADEWGSRFLPVSGSEGLAAGATTKPLVLTASHGYTGTEPRADILKNSHFVDAKVE